MSRINAIDFTRAIAMIIIVTCHYLSFGGVNGFNDLGHYMGYVGNFIFFAVSALLFGMMYAKKGVDAFEARPFLKKRVGRLFSSLWPFLLFALPLYYLYGAHLNPFKVIMNFLGLGWFGKLPYIGHLWFVTMFIFCYIMYVIYCRWFYKKGTGRTIWTILFVICIMLQIILDKLQLPGTLFIILFYSLWIFKNSSLLLSWFEKSKFVFIVPIVIITNIVAIYACFNSFALGTTLTHWAGYIAGAFLLIFLMKLGKMIKCGKTLMFLSLTGYEIYLVHHGLCSGPLSVIHLTEYPIVNYGSLWVCSICFGLIFKQIGDKLNSFFKSKGI